VISFCRSGDNWLALVLTTPLLILTLLAGLIDHRDRLQRGLVEQNV